MRTTVQRKINSLYRNTLNIAFFLFVVWAIKVDIFAKVTKSRGQNKINLVNFLCRDGVTYEKLLNKMDYVEKKR